jgi:hypothetical protein
MNSSHNLFLVNYTTLPAHCKLHYEHNAPLSYKFRLNEILPEAVLRTDCVIRCYQLVCLTTIFIVFLFLTYQTIKEPGFILVCRVLVSYTGVSLLFDFLYLHFDFGAVLKRKCEFVGRMHSNPFHRSIPQLLIKDLNNTVLMP